MELEGFSTETFTHDGTPRTVFRRGDGPAVVVMHEIPGITPPVARFATIVADAGFSVWMPWLFGTPGRPLSPGYLASSFAHVCIQREFSMLARHASSPITTWLRALCRHAHAQCGGPGVGAIGMCLTGNFALALMVEPCLMAPVLSQPSLPFGVSRAHRAALHVSDAELAQVRRRTEEGCTVLGLRFSADPLCPSERFDTLRRELGDGFEAIEIDSGRGNAHGIPRIAHSVVTTDLVDEDGHPTRAALDRVLELFAERLRPTA